MGPVPLRLNGKATALAAQLCVAGRDKDPKLLQLQSLQSLLASAQAC